MDDRLRRLKDKANKLPLTPGVYIMRDKGGNIIYVGKAKALKNRVSQYFGSQEKHLPKVRKMVEHVADFDYILTDSEFEALVLECSLIKQHMPKYNILLKDDKGYSFIKITGGEWRNIWSVYRKEDDGATYMGPYTAGYTVSMAVDEAKRVYKLPTCSKVFPRDIGSCRPCLNYFIGLCSAPCAGKISRPMYDQSVEAALKLLKIGSAETVKELKAEMDRAAENLEFEKAARIRDSIRSIEKAGNRQKVVSATYREQDVFALSVADGKACFAVLRFRDGSLKTGEHFFVEELDTPEAMRAQLLTSYYSIRTDIPPRIMIDGPVEESTDLERFLTEKRGANVHLVIPQKGEQLQLLEMCRQNAEQKLCEKAQYKNRSQSALAELGLLLGLPEAPAYIEAYDISHTGGSDNVGGMVVFADGRPLRKAYRRFAVKGFSGQDDYRSMAEVLDRRFAEYEKHQNDADNTSGFGKKPDLILLDGGKGQVSAVLPLLEKYGLNIPLFGMVKDSRHRTSAISTDNGRIEFSAKKKAFGLVTEIQDEVHRFAVAYHHQKHTKSAFSQTLTTIPGIGEVKAKALIASFKTLDVVGKAEPEQLAAVKGISKSDAEAIYRAFHGE